MRKRIINQSSHDVPSADQGWLDLNYLAQVELTSEDPAHPIESALTSETGTGWKAAQAGKQTIRILFDEPQSIRRIYLQFDEETQKRTQEVVLRWSASDGQPYQEILRQQYTFSPPWTIREIEDYAVDLHGVKVLELNIVPDIDKGNVLASLAKLRVA
jgi:hypothetical protein